MSPDEDSDNEKNVSGRKGKEKWTEYQPFENIDPELLSENDGTSARYAGDINSAFGAGYSPPDLDGVPQEDYFDIIAGHFYGGDAYIPDDIRSLKSNLIPHVDGNDILSWTWKSSLSWLPMGGIPISFAGRPIIIPLESLNDGMTERVLNGSIQFPQSLKRHISSVDPLGDEKIDPGQLLSQWQIDAFFSEYELAIGLYLMLNGSLYAIMPRSITEEQICTLLLQKFPRFGGLRVEYVFEGAKETGGEETEEERIVARIEALRMEVLSNPYNSPRIPRIGQDIESFPWFSEDIWYSEKQRPEAFQKRQVPTKGKVGLIVAQNDSLFAFATVSTHIINTSLSNVGVLRHKQGSFHNVAIRGVGKREIVSAKSFHISYHPITLHARGVCFTKPQVIKGIVHMHLGDILLKSQEQTDW